MLPALDNSPPHGLQILLTARQLFVIRQTLSRKGRWEPIHAEAPRQDHKQDGDGGPLTPVWPAVIPSCRRSTRRIPACIYSSEHHPTCSGPHPRRVRAHGTSPTVGAAHSESVHPQPPLPSADVTVDMLSGAGSGRCSQMRARQHTAPAAPGWPEPRRVISADPLRVEV